ncbi:MAG: hypothetical protein P4L85_11550 [Paludisphaera borealis]|uniref:hypothetical protein n=1 Tax=Paludisphaera borealis TaxID=1387353 RepID=UPI0028465D03|nr:hypothetical protein [Paludisphaera borealis]MDR3619976.1 hypothetical protein [Paludisphaera borealis]
MRRRKCLVLLALPIVSALAGCASRDPSKRFGRGRGVGGPMGAEGATIGRNLKAMPAGRVIPATGLGVDLVDSRRPAVAPRQGVDGRQDADVETTSSSGRIGSP